MKRVSTVDVNVYPVVLYTYRGPIIFNLWDTVGEQSWSFATEKNKRALNGAQGAILMYDTTAIGSSSIHILDWKRDLERSCLNYVDKRLIIMAGNKCDSKWSKTNQMVKNGKYREGMKQEMKHFYTSSRKNINLEETLLSLAQELSGDDQLRIVNPWQHYEVLNVAEAAATPLPESDDEDDEDDILL